jgi:hypothetical protein
MMDGVENVVLDTLSRPAPLSVAAYGRAATCGKKAGGTTAKQQRVPLPAKAGGMAVTCGKQAVEAAAAGTECPPSKAGGRAANFGKQAEQVPALYSSQHHAPGLEGDC